MSALTATHGHTGHRDLTTALATSWPTYVVVATAAVSSWAGWVLLGEATRFGHLGHLDLAWLLPVSVDTYAFAAARAWRTGHTRPTRRWGFWSALAALALSIAGNAGGHAASAGVWHPGWVAVVVVAMVPPAVLFAVLLLVTMTGRDQRAASDRAASRAANGGGQRPAPAPATTPPAPVAASGQAAGVHAAYERLHAAGHVNGARTVATYQTLAAETGKSERTVRRHMATYQPEDH